MPGFRKRQSREGSGSLLGDFQAGRIDSSPGSRLRAILLWSASATAGGLIAAGIIVLVLQAQHNGSGAAEVVYLPTPYPDNVIICEADPIELDEGTDTILEFRAQELQGYELTGLELTPSSENAPSDALDAIVRGSLSALLQANASEDLTDEPASYELRAMFNRNDAEIISLCTVRVSPLISDVSGASVSSGSAAGGTVTPVLGETVTPVPTSPPRVIEARLTTPPTPTPAPTATPTRTPAASATPKPTQDPGFYRD